MGGIKNEIRREDGRKNRKENIPVMDISEKEKFEKYTSKFEKKIKMNTKKKLKNTKKILKKKTEKKTEKKTKKKVGKITSTRTCMMDPLTACMGAFTS